MWLTVGGQTFVSVGAAAKAFGKKPNTVHRRVLRGKTLEEALVETVKVEFTEIGAGLDRTITLSDSCSRFPPNA